MTGYPFLSPGRNQNLTPASMTGSPPLRVYLRLMANPQDAPWRSGINAEAQRRGGAETQVNRTQPLRFWHPCMDHAWPPAHSTSSVIQHNINDYQIFGRAPVGCAMIASTLDCQRDTRRPSSAHQLKAINLNQRVHATHPSAHPIQ